MSKALQLKIQRFENKLARDRELLDSLEQNQRALCEQLNRTGNAAERNNLQRQIEALDREIEAALARYEATETQLVELEGSSVPSQPSTVPLASERPAQGNTYVFHGPVGSVGNQGTQANVAGAVSRQIDRPSAWMKWMADADRDIEHDDLEKLVSILARAATFSLDGPEAFFRDLLRSANLPEAFFMEAIGQLRGAPDAIARQLVHWAKAKGTNPQDSRFTTLGSLFQPLLPKSGLETATTLVASIVRYRLYRNPQLLDALAARYQLPLPLVCHAPGSMGPEFAWRGTEDRVELEGLLQRRQTISWDVSFLQSGIERAAAVCRIELANGQALGTGCLIAPTLVLTNYHVLAPHPDSDPYAYLDEIVLRFRCTSAPAGQETSGQTFKLAADPLVMSSPVQGLDYVLLQVDAAIESTSDIAPAPVNWQHSPTRSTGINLLQHPLGKTMQIALSPNGVTGVYPEAGVVQYISDTAQGSSGSPCFNDNWQVVAIHHAQKSGPFGIYCEGILASAIYKEVQHVL